MLRPERAVFSYVRMNPPTRGHQYLLWKVLSLATEWSCDHVVYISRSHDTFKNPIPPYVKMGYLKELFPNINFKMAEGSLIDAIVDLSKDHSEAVMVAGSDRSGGYSRILKTYNGAGQFKFNECGVLSIERDGAKAHKEVIGISATRARGLAKLGWFEDFWSVLPAGTSEETARMIFDDVRHGMLVSINIGTEERARHGQVPEKEEAELTVPGRR